MCVIKRTSDKWPKSCECVCSVRASARSQTRSMASGSSENPFPPSAPLSSSYAAIPPTPIPDLPSRKTFSFQSLIFPAFLCSTTADSVHHLFTTTPPHYTISLLAFILYRFILRSCTQYIISFLAFCAKKKKTTHL